MPRAHFTALYGNVMAVVYVCICVCVLCSDACMHVYMHLSERSVGIPNEQPRIRVTVYNYMPACSEEFVCLFACMYV